MKVAVIGAGLIGRSWAIAFARAGWDVALFDKNSEAAATAVEICRSGLEDLARVGLCSDAAKSAFRLTCADSLDGALDGASLVQENAPEDLGTKTALFAELDRIAPENVLLASSTSAFQCSTFTENLPGRGRCLVAHPVNPPHLIPVVELSGSRWTSAESLTRARGIYEAIGQVPVTVLKEIDGFILNRLQAALLAEAFRLVEGGFVTPEDLDHTVCDGLGLRWALMGPFETIELNAPGGLPDYIERGAPFFRRFCANPAPVSTWDEARTAAVVSLRKNIPGAEERQAKMRERDRRLASLILTKRQLAAG